MVVADGIVERNSNPTDGIDDAGSKTLRDAFKRYGGASLFAPGHSPLGLLPVTSAAVESLIKEFNYRVKGTEKFWNRPEGTERILQVRAAVLSDDDRLSKHLKSRPGSPFRRYRAKAEN